MSLTTPTRDNGYQIPLEQDATRAFFQGIFIDVHERLAALELTEADYEAAINLITTQALASVTASIGQEIADQRAVLLEIQANAEAVLRAYEEISLSGVPATTIRVQPVDGLSATNVQAAIVEILTRKVTTERLENKSVTFAKQADIAEARFIGRRADTGDGSPEALTTAQAKSLLGKFANTDLVDVPAGTLKGRRKTADGAPEDLTPAQALDLILGFTPVQQGGVTGQLTNKLRIGWGGFFPKIQVDAIDLGRMWTDYEAARSFGVSGYQRFPGGLIRQWGVYAGGVSDGNVFFPFVFPNACVGVSPTPTFPVQANSLISVHVPTRLTNQFSFRTRAAIGGVVDTETSGFSWRQSGTDHDQDICAFR